MLFRSAWMTVWLMVSLKTQTLGPKAATGAPGHIDAGGAAAGLAVAAGGARTASPSPRARSDRDRPGSRRGYPLRAVRPDRSSAAAYGMICTPPGPVVVE